jgi:CheY-like chemotaxis protein
MNEQLRIAVADEDRAVRECVRLWLTELGYEVTTLADGRHLVELCVDAPPDLVVSGVRMQGVDGVTAAEIIRCCGPTPIVLMSGGWSADQLERARAIGVVCVDKPFRPLELVAAIEAARATTKPAAGLTPAVRLATATPAG